MLAVDARSFGRACFYAQMRFSIGQLSSQCRFYRHVSYDPVIIIEGDFHYGGHKEKIRVILTEGETVDGISL